MKCPPCTQDCRQGRQCGADDDQSQPGPWWVVPSFAVLALVLVAASYGVFELVNYLGGCK
jgi:hypothetical protein